MSQYHYQYVPDFFSPSDWDADIHGAFGLNEGYDWERFKRDIQDLKAKVGDGETIKVLFTARHGEAEHNILSDLYNEPADIVQINHPIVDPLLTKIGRDQASLLGQAFVREHARGMPIPTRFFVSPLRRPGETCGLEWGWLFPDSRRGERDMGHGVPAEVVEELREHLHVHQCDMRLPQTELKKLFPSFAYPSHMVDIDTVWKSGEERGRETEEELVERAAKGLSIVFDSCPNDTYVSITCHSGIIRGLLKTLGVPLHRFVVGEMNVIVMRARLETSALSSTTD